MSLSFSAAGAARLPLIDALKAVAAQLIVLHHLAFYGPLSDTAEALIPALIGWLSHSGRLAVQMFLVVAGFLAARRLAPSGLPLVRRPLATVATRYLRLTVPYALSLALAIAGSAIARLLMQHDSVPAVPTVPQVLAHIMLVQSILGYDALTAGAWYIAIDFQLFAVATLLLWSIRRCSRRPELVRSETGMAFALLAIVSLLHFNLDARWDVWAIYFFGAYALGALAWWSSAGDRSLGWLVLLFAACLVVMAFNTRPHTLVAAGTALVLGIARRGGLLDRGPQSPVIAFLGRISYSQFLVHFPVCLVVSAVFVRWLPERPLFGTIGMLSAWAASIAAGAWFHRVCELPLAERLTWSIGRRVKSGFDPHALPAAHRG